MAKIDLGDIWTIANHAIFKPGVNGKAGTVTIVRKKHSRLSYTEAAIKNREHFAKVARECAGKKVGEFLKCVMEKRKGVKFKRTG